jgi:hypothetical protein
MIVITAKKIARFLDDFLFDKKVVIQIPNTIEQKVNPEPENTSKFRKVTN